MSRVLSIRISSELYKRLKAEDKPLKEMVITALNRMYTGVYNKEIEDEYQKTCEEVDAFLRGLEAK